jgi:hypothetical protein
VCNKHVAIVHPADPFHVHRAACVCVRREPPSASPQRGNSALANAGLLGRTKDAFIFDLCAYLSPSTLCSLMQCCKHVFVIAASEDVWKHKVAMICARIPQLSVLVLYSPGVCAGRRQCCRVPRVLERHIRSVAQPCFVCLWKRDKAWRHIL